MIELQVVGGRPVGLDLAPLVAVVAALNEAGLTLPSGTVNLRLVDDAEIRKLNREYSAHDYATDVLSFSYIESGAAIEGDIGDMVISLETAERQAQQAGTNLATELGLLGLHGLLHIGGYDHADQAARATLDQLQRQIMTAAGLPYRDFKWES